ncbi:MAG: DnaA/Hda family protein [Terriglobales bacterium]|jgi:hypothetical protein
MQKHRFSRSTWILETKVAILHKKAEQKKVRLSKDVALYIAENISSDARALEDALACLVAHSSRSGADLTLNYAKDVLNTFIGRQPPTATVDPFQRIFGQGATKQAERTRPAPATPDLRFVLCLLKSHEGEQRTRVKQELEVNVREREREQLTRLDAYERALERLAKTRKRV